MSDLIPADDGTLSNVYGRGVPVVIYLHDGEDNYKPTTDALRKLAKKHDGEIAVASVNATDNPTTAAKYQHLKLPAIITMERRMFGMREKSTAEEARPSDARAHVAFLLGTGDDPAEIAARKQAKQPAPKSATRDASARTFKRDVLKSKTPVLVDFWAPWCGPCRQVSPLLEQLGEEYKGRVRVVKVNVDENESLSRKYGIASIPTVMIFKGGTVVESTYGAQSKRKYQRMIDDALID